MHVNIHARTRQRLLGAVLVWAAIGAALVWALPADARSQTGITVKKGDPTRVYAYGPIPAQDPVTPTAAVLTSPPRCADGGPRSASCDHIPLRIEPPVAKETDEFYVDIWVSWDDPNEVNDVDFYVFDNQQILARDGDPETTGYTEKGSGASSANPEHARLYRPTLGDYNITVNNFSGANLGYTVTVKFTFAEFHSPTELLATTTTTTTVPPLSDEPTSDESDDFEQELAGSPTPSSGGPSDSGSSISEDNSTPKGVDLPMGTIGEDTDFDVFSRGSNFDNELAASADADDLANFQRLQERAAASVKKPSGVVLLVWFVGLPAALLAAGGSVLLKRRRTLLAVA
jgi:hypothetical protein